MATTAPPPPSTALDRLLSLDAVISRRIHTLFSPFIPVSLLRLLEFSGDGRLWFPLTLSLLLSSPSSSLIISLLIALLLDIVVIGLIKHVVTRPRPEYNSVPMGPTLPVDHWSFPSGHASRVCAIACVFCLQGREEYDGVVVAIGVWVWAAVTAGSRVLLGRHYVMDVVVGVWIGMIVGIVADRFARVYVLDKFDLWN